MLRHLHSWPGLLAALLISLLAISGAFLAAEPMLNQVQHFGTSSGGSVAELAGLVAEKQPGVERLVHKASGEIVAYGRSDDDPWAVVIDQKTALTTAKYAPSASFGFATDLHRSLLNGDSGRAVVGVGSGILLLLGTSGLFLLAKRNGGWSGIFRPSQGSFQQRLHSDVAKWSLGGVIISAATGIYMSLATFGFVADGSGADTLYPSQVLGALPMPVAELDALIKLEISDLRELVFPFQGDAMDVFSLSTNAGRGYIDQASGQLLSFAPNTIGQSIYETIYMLHTGQGGGLLSALLALILGLSALGIPVLGFSGIKIWWARQQQIPKMPKNCPVSKADIVVLVGSEGNATWSFAATLVRVLQTAGKRVHTAPMNALAGDHFGAGRLVILTSTYGDGEAPSNADKFLGRIANLNVPPTCQISVLGFGDRQFHNFCGFAQQVEQELVKQGCKTFLPLTTINQQCPQSFARWGEDLGRFLGLELALTHKSKEPMSQSLVLSEIVARSDLRENVSGADISILRFSAVSTTPSVLSGVFRKALPKFAAGDLIGVLPPGGHTARYYSLASSSKNGFLEICVKRHPHGVCSNFLHSLTPGDNIRGFVKGNPAFKTRVGRTPIILVGAGTGMAPLAGFARENTAHRPMHLYWGGQSPAMDFVYKDTVVECLRAHSLTRAVAAFSKCSKRQYVQDKLYENAGLIRTLTAEGAQFLICGGQPMAAGVRSTLDDILKPNGLTVNDLKAEQRYLEDVY